MINIAFIGAGDVANRHAEAIAACPTANLLGLWSIDTEEADSKSSCFDCRRYESAETLLADAQVDAVFVLTNLETHCQYARLAIAAGKHVLVEKPVGSNVAEIEALRDAAAAADRVCMPGHNYIYESGLARSKRLLTEGRLGQLVAVYVMYHIAHPEAVAARYPGVIQQILTHHAYILIYLGDPPVSAMAMKTSLHYETLTQEDFAMVNMKLASGALAHFSASFAADDHSADPWSMMVKVVGTEGSTRFSYHDWVENRAADVHSQVYTAYYDSFHTELHHFVDACIGKGMAPLSTLDDAIAALRVIKACERSTESGQLESCLP